MKLSDIFKKKSDLEREIAARRSAALSAERALTMCDQIEKEMPGHIAEIEAQPVFLAFSQYNAIGDFSGSGDLNAQRRQLEAARSILADLPEIRAHWTKVRDSIK